MVGQVYSDDGPRYRTVFSVHAPSVSSSSLHNLIKGDSISKRYLPRCARLLMLPNTSVQRTHSSVSGRSMSDNRGQCGPGRHLAASRAAKPAAVPSASSAAPSAIHSVSANTNSLLFAQLIGTRPANSEHSRSMTGRHCLSRDPHWLDKAPPRLRDRRLGSETAMALAKRPSEADLSPCLLGRYTPQGKMLATKPHVRRQGAARGAMVFRARRPRLREA